MEGKMRIVFLTNVLTKHQIPLAQEIIKLIGEENYRYIYTNSLDVSRQGMGWNIEPELTWAKCSTTEDRALLEADTLLSGLRVEDIFEERLRAGKTTLYVSERWFKPPFSILRLLSPRYFRMAWRIVKSLRHPKMTFLGMGIHAVRDMLRLEGLFRGDLRCLFRAPKTAFEPVPGGRVFPLAFAEQAGFLTAEEARFARKYGFVRISSKSSQVATPPAEGIWRNVRIFGYFVARSVTERKAQTTPERRVLWVGRMLSWKRPEIILRAVRRITSDIKISAAFFGRGSQKKKLMREAKNMTNVRFHDFLPNDAIRNQMRLNDIFVLPSNAYEGWGAVVNEAIEEGMCVFASVESGAGATMLPIDNLFSSNDYVRLAKLLSGSITPLEIGEWTPKCGAEAIFKIIGEESRTATENAKCSGYNRSGTT